MKLSRGRLESVVVIAALSVFNAEITRTIVALNVLACGILHALAVPLFCYD